VVTDAGKEFKAHRDVLAEVTPFFEKLFNSNIKERNEGIVRLGIVSESVVRFFEVYVHWQCRDIGSTARRRTNPSSRLSFIYKPQELRWTVSDENSACFKLYLLPWPYFAKKYHCEKFVDFTKDFFHINFTAVAKCEEILNLSREEVERWISSDEINVSAEEDVFEISCRWINQNKEEQSPKFNGLFLHVRLVDISRECLSKKIMEESLHGRMSRNIHSQK